MGRLGVLKFMGKRAEMMEMYVFDDAFVMTPPRAFRAGLAFGAVGGVASAVNDKRKATQRRETVEALGDDAGSSDVAASLDGSERVPWASVSEVRVEKGLGLARKLIVTTDDGTERSYRYGEKQQPTPDVEAVLGPILGERLSNRMR